MECGRISWIAWNGSNEIGRKELGRPFWSNNLGRIDWGRIGSNGIGSKSICCLPRIWHFSRSTQVHSTQFRNVEDSTHGTGGRFDPFLSTHFRSPEFHRICYMARSLRSLRQVATLRHGHMARRFAPAFTALGVCERIWLRYKNFDPSCFDPIQKFGMSTWGLTLIFDPVPSTYFRPPSSFVSCFLTPYIWPLFMASFKNMEIFMGGLFQVPFIWPYHNSNPWY